MPKALRLLVKSPGEVRVAVAEATNANARRKIEVLVIVGVVDIYAIAPLERKRGAGIHRHERGYIRPSGNHGSWRSMKTL
jgi:hypothetical protein